MTRRGIYLLFLSLALHLLGHFLHFWTGWTQTLAYVVSQFMVLLPVSFPPARFSDWHVVPLWRGVDQIHPTIKSDFTVQGEGIFLGVIPEEADNHKKSESTKINNQTNKQPNENKKHLLQFQRWTAPGASCSFSGSWCHRNFDAFCVSFFLLFFLFRSPQIIPPPPSLTSTALWLQVAHPRVELTALQCTKRAS